MENIRISLRSSFLRYRSRRHFTCQLLFPIISVDVLTGNVDFSRVKKRAGRNRNWRSLAREQSFVTRYLSYTPIVRSSSYNLYKIEANRRESNRPRILLEIELRLMLRQEIALFETFASGIITYVAIGRTIFCSMMLRGIVKNFKSIEEWFSVNLHFRFVFDCCPITMGALYVRTF